MFHSASFFNATLRQRGGVGGVGGGGDYDSIRIGFVPFSFFYIGGTRGRGVVPPFIYLLYTRHLDGWVVGGGVSDRHRHCGTVSCARLATAILLFIVVLFFLYWRHRRRCGSRAALASTGGPLGPPRGPPGMAWCRSFGSRRSLFLPVVSLILAKAVVNFFIKINQITRNSFKFNSQSTSHIDGELIWNREMNF